jgi:membrane protein YdbS with pleckstrin-like domain
MNISSYFDNRLLIKKSPVIIVKNFIVLQMAAVAIFFLAAVAADYGDIYEQLPFSRSFSFHVVEAAGIFIFETVLVFYIFFAWYKEYYDIKADKILYGKGIVFRKRTSIPLSSIKKVEYNQGPLGKLTKYGTIHLWDGTPKGSKLEHIPDPATYVELIIRLKNNMPGERIGTQDSIEKILADGEHEWLEFKSSFRWDLNQNKVNKNIEKSVMKTIVAFMNSGGGQLLIGVDDFGNIVGLEPDYKSLPKQNADGFQNHFNHVFHAMIGPNLRQFVELSVQKVGDKDCCLVKVVASDKPAYLKFEEREEFYIRTGNGTTSLKLSEASSYIDSHWKARLL